jgi:hypothetical protein
MDCVAQMARRGRLDCGYVAQMARRGCHDCVKVRLIYVPVGSGCT